MPQFNPVIHESTNSGAGPSGFWGRTSWFPGQPIDPNKGYGCFYEFLNQPSLADGDTIDFAAQVGGGCYIRGAQAEVGGVLGLEQDGTDNDEIWLQMGGNRYAPFRISDTAGADKKLAFEARFKVNTIANDVCALFVGLGEEGLAAASTKTTDTGVMASKDFIGFDTVHVNGGTTGINALVNVVYRKAGQTAQTLISSVHTLIASTWVKVGLLYQPEASTDKRIAFYVDGVEQGTYVTAAMIAAATFPDGEFITPLIGTKAGTGTASTFSLDWLAIYQER